MTVYASSLPFLLSLAHFCLTRTLLSLCPFPEWALWLLETSTPPVTGQLCSDDLPQLTGGHLSGHGRGEPEDGPQHGLAVRRRCQRPAVALEEQPLVLALEQQQQVIQQEHVHLCREAAESCLTSTLFPTPVRALTHSFVFGYSPREGAFMDQLLLSDVQVLRQEGAMVS